MKVLGRDIRPEALLASLEARLKQRGISEQPEPITVQGVEPRVDPAAFYLGALEANADPTRPLPLEAQRGGAIGQGALLARQLLRTLVRPVLAEVLGRQRLFNGYTRDAVMELFEQLEDLRAQLEALRAERAPAETPARRPRKPAPGIPPPVRSPQKTAAAPKPKKPPPPRRPAPRRSRPKR